MNYLSKPPPQTDEYYYEEDSYALNKQSGGFRPNTQGSNQENWCEGQNYGNYNLEGQYGRDRNDNCDNNLNRGNYGKRNDRSVDYVTPQNCEVAPRDGGGSMA